MKIGCEYIDSWAVSDRGQNGRINETNLSMERDFQAMMNNFFFLLRDFCELKTLKFVLMFGALF